MNHKRFVLFLVALGSVLIQDRISLGDETVMQGRAMGMPYRIVVASGLPEEQREKVKAAVLSTFEVADKTFSLYRADSEISLWNANVSTDWIPVSQPFADLFEHSRKLSQATKGAFDPTIRPLSKLWRFDQVDSNWVPPTENAVADKLSMIGIHFVHSRYESAVSLKKDLPTIELDFNALVEGWCLERIAETMDSIVSTNYLVSLGGEYLGRGKNLHGEPWRVMIESPTESQTTEREKSHATYYVELTDLCVSTSGTYRSGHVHQGKWFGHLLDARTGYPIPRERLLASVVSNSAMEADGWATALLTMDDKSAIKASEELQLASLLITETDQELRHSLSANGHISFRSTVHNANSSHAWKLTAKPWMLGGLCLVAAILVISIIKVRSRA